MRETLPKAFEPTEVEGRWYRYWEENGFFRPSDEPGSPRFSIVIPPPNVTGALHMGHAFCFTLHDVLVRWRRMRGASTLWLPGTDHAGIATQNVVEKALLLQGKSRKELGRGSFEQEVWNWKAEYGGRIVDQLRKLGTSCDWERQRFTLDEGLSQAVREVFVRLFEEGLIYKGEYIVNWCPRCETAISDLETVYETLEGRLYYVKYPVAGTSEHIQIATTRPETMLGDTAVAVNPHDERFAHLIGRKLVLPVVGREIPIIVDEAVEKDFGTGMVKVTPSHDPNDFEMGRRHGLDFVQVIDETGVMSEAAGKYAGMDRFECRTRLLEELESLGLLVKIDKHVHNVGHCQRCSTVIEPLVSSQWFVKIRPLADTAMEAVREGKIRFFPERYEKTYFGWMENIHDWCISRQLWWGHRIPAWHCLDCGKHTVTREDPDHCAHCGSARIRQEEDVLDTWFSSALWPFSTLGWPEKTPDLERYYPTDLLITGFDIIFFWVARMIMMGLKFMGDVPFRTVYIHGLVRDENNQKMSKSKGNVIDPLQIMGEYGTDAMRFTMAVMAMPGSDLPFKLDRMVGYRAFANKIWNAARFLMMKLPEDLEPASDGRMRELLAGGDLGAGERWILHRFSEVAARAEEALEGFLFHEAADALYHFFWHEFCDWYIELAKIRMEGSEPAVSRATAEVLLFVLERSLRLLHPFMPYLTEEIWQKLPHEGPSLMVSAFPKADPAFVDAGAVREIAFLQEFVTTIRTLRSENNLQPGARLPLEYAAAGNPDAALVERFAREIALLAGLESLKAVDSLSEEAGAIKGISCGMALQLLAGSLVDVAAEKARLDKEIRRLEDEVDRSERKLGNAEFMAKAPADVVEKNRQKLAEHAAKLAAAREARTRLGD